MLDVLEFDGFFDEYDDVDWEKFFIEAQPYEDYYDYYQNQEEN